MSDERPDARSAFEAGLANEYFALSGLRASSIGEAGTRATLFFTTLTGTVLALGFLASSTNAPRSDHGLSAETATIPRNRLMAPSGVKLSPS